MMPPLRLQPILKQRPWGGRRLAERWNKASGRFVAWAESWEVADLGDDQSRVIGGPFDGQLLGQLVRERGTELLGPHAAPGPFPLLFKFLDAAETLSVQVHPNDEQAARLTPGQCGKSEAWVVIAAEPGSQFSVGLKSGVDRATLEQHLAAGTVADCLHSFPARVGDVVSVPAGTVHAIGAGVALAEIQQSSDVTFRLFDWHRLDAHGRPRPLHIGPALQCINFTRLPASPLVPRELDSSEFTDETPSAPEATRHEELIVCEHFEWRRHSSSGPAISLRTDGRCRVVSIIEGAAVMTPAAGSELLGAGQTLVVPASCDRVTFEPQTRCTLLDAVPARQFLPHTGNSG